MYKRILVPMETAQHQAPALAHARDLAGRIGAQVVLLWLVPVIDSGEPFFDQIQVDLGSVGGRKIDEGQVFLEGAAKEFSSAGVALETHVLTTPKPLERAILDFALDRGMDLIIMPTLPRSAVGRFLFGSVDEKVRRRSPIPVLFVSATQPSNLRG